MQKRLRFKQLDSLQDRLIQQAENFRKQAEQLPAGIQREQLFKKAQQAEITAQVDDWLSSPGQHPPQ
jgi:hypothetical protein